LAAAFYNQAAPPGWKAVSAGLEPQILLGDTAQELLGEDVARPFLDLTPPRAMDAVSASKVIAIDCHVSGAEVWELEHRDVGPGMREELRLKVRQMTSGQ